MKLLVYSPAFHPRIGGLEINIAHFATEAHRLGCEVAVVTTTENSGSEPFDFPVIRRPSPGELLHWARWCDIFYQANVSLRGLWPLLFVRRPWAVSHHSWYRHEGGRLAWQDRLKRFLLRYAAASIAVSEALAADLKTPTTVIPNPYRDNLFRMLPNIDRARDLVFLGRLVSDKGVDVLVEALGHLADRGLRPGLTIVGDGPEAPRIRDQAERLGVFGQIDMLGIRTDEELVRILNQHRILVVPSRYNEPFGIVALEGIACGCVVVGSRGGGLREAIGPCGRTFPNGDSAQLAAILADLLGHPERYRAYRHLARLHLAEHAGERVTRRYLQTLQATLDERAA
ncbi:MAG TPA: glycosyltransferase family 4 protein [Thermoanaerobaculia bacterium]|nr:glycosyltransferase family 4 protein [Thermoanaerobaculia bacterium]